MWCSDVEAMFTGSKLNRLLLRKLFQDTLGGSSPSADEPRWNAEGAWQWEPASILKKQGTSPRTPRLASCHIEMLLNTAALENARVSMCTITQRRVLPMSISLQTACKKLSPKTRPHTSLHFYLYEAFHTHSAFPFEHLTSNLTCNLVIILSFSVHLPSQRQTYTGTFGGDQLRILLDFLMLTAAGHLN